jgi:two-component system cell cycle response regulator
MSDHETMTDDWDLDDLDYDSWSDRTVDGVMIDSARQTPQDEAEGYVIVIAGGNVGRMIKVDHELVIGRSRSADFNVKDASVSKEHVCLAPDDNGRIIARDLGSRNGTFVNGERIDTRVLTDGDKIYIGTTTILKFSLADSLEESFQQQMYQAAIRDPLTSLFNRRHLDERLDSEFAYSRRHRTPLSIVMIDVDHFKRINDEFGHAAGDAVLAKLAHRINDTIRREDFVARFGGEEFIIVCRGTETALARVVAERIRQIAEATALVPGQDNQLVTLSAGVAGVPDANIDTMETLIDAADRALYRAKRDGRNRVCVFDSEVDHD